jgi:BASS family bile acid:Na+ symporter
LLAAALAMPFPWLFTWLKGPLIVLALAVVMLGMGLELELGDFRRVLRRPATPALGVAAQYLVMPALAALVAWLLRLSPPLAVGLILVGCCPGGTASNVVTLIARADVALSVVMTTVSTLAAVLLTPLLTGLLAGRYVPVDGWKLLLDVCRWCCCRWPWGWA